MNSEKSIPILVDVVPEAHTSSNGVQGTIIGSRTATPIAASPILLVFLIHRFKSYPWSDGPPVPFHLVLSVNGNGS